MSMKRLLTVFLPLLAFAYLFTACSDDDDPVEVVQYPLPERMELDVADVQPVLVKTEAEFNDLFGDYANQLPGVDFTKYDLVYAQGASQYGVVSFESWIDGDTPPYRLVVHIKQDYTLPYVRWAVAYLLPKNDDNRVTVAVSIEKAEVPADTAEE